MKLGGYEMTEVKPGGDGEGERRGQILGIFKVGLLMAWM